MFFGGSMQYLKWYGGPITGFYGRIEINRYEKGATKLHLTNLPWAALIEERAKNPFPDVRVDPHGSDYENEKRANELIELLNATDDIMVFKIAMNTLFRLVQGERAAPLYPGEQYRPDLLEEAIRLSEEE